MVMCLAAAAARCVTATGPLGRALLLPAALKRYPTAECFCCCPAYPLPFGCLLHRPQVRGRSERHGARYLLPFGCYITIHVLYNLIKIFILHRRFVAGQSVMVHEFGHVVHILGFSPCQLRQLEQRFEQAYASGAYDTSECQALVCGLNRRLFTATLYGLRPYRRAPWQPTHRGHRPLADDRACTLRSCDDHPQLVLILPCYNAWVHA